MNITSTTKYISRTLIDNYLNDIYTYLSGQYGWHVAERDMYPLKWYINSGRASLAFLGKMIDKKPYMIGRKLHQGGSYEDAVNRICSYIGYERC